MIPDLTRTELAARLRSSIEGKEAWDYVATNVGLVASAVQFLAPSAGIADAMIADAKRQLGKAAERTIKSPMGDAVLLYDHHAAIAEASQQAREEAYARGRGDAVREYIEKGDQRTAGGDAVAWLYRIPKNSRLAFDVESRVYLLDQIKEAKEHVRKYGGTLHPLVCGSITPAPVSAADPSDGPSDDKILDALVEALDVDRAGAMKLILRVAGAHLDEREAV